MSELALEATPEVAAAAHQAAGGQVIYLTEDGNVVAATVPALLAAELGHLTASELRELLEDFADGAAAREALAEIEAVANPIPAGQVWAELGI